ncbi:hypothetical protein [Candidatus Villigracilis affinis]|uniref:hypothetical protein n=1 Tax=Candidatus Villigracilis affinis TaxID=3140682 RepID=UPI002A191EFC|nr:hypothetical protein [Anaerolineales bacterium]
MDSSALIAGVISENGAAHVLLQLGETEDVSLKISELVFNETTRSIGRKSPENLENIQKEIEKARIVILQDPSHETDQAGKSTSKGSRTDGGRCHVHGGKGAGQEMKIVLDLKVVMDTNVFVSGVFFSGPPYEILKAW